MEQLLLEIQSMNRESVTAALCDFQCEFPMDFSQDFLDQCSDEKLRHILLAAHLYAQRDHVKA